ncbi:acyl-CoA synthetase [Rhodovibrio salinarum]|uniref:AMP-dependent synthetase n=1 Tax=Rhodovibrio salinarum TaxID=1087 RepID=A0A934QJX3_9PROT|nr:acyl-CoA synthetase [Rhodovibrio salinarum]MBK1698109.1 AMP-dependent synthetase [Rhodovibrio salinarum]
MLPDVQGYDALVRDFRWNMPARYNIAEACCDRWAAATPDAPALIRCRDAGVQAVSFRTLRQRADKLANALQALGVTRGDRVGILLPQCVEAAEAHLAVYKLGAVAIPLFTLFGPDALAYRLADSGAKALIGTAEELGTVQAIADQVPDLRHWIAVHGDAPGAHGYEALLTRARDRFETADTAADEPAVVIYTSGTTGNPKGALHAHRVLLGHLPGVEFPHEMFPKPGDRFWTPADWAWIGGLLDVLLPALAHGVPVVAHRFAKFDPEQALALMAATEVRNTFMPPTALKMLRQVDRPAERFGVRLRSIGSGGETLGAELLDWGRDAFGLTINEFYGQTECNLVVGNCAGQMAVRPGAMGRPIPGHTVAVLDADGHPLPPGQEGRVAIRAPDPVMFLEYLNKPEATRAKFTGDWLLTGDTATTDQDGYLWFVGRDDDVITSAGYRIGPGEVEDCLGAHPAVAMVAVVGVPDELRGQRIKAFIVLNPGHDAGDTLTCALQDHVKTRLAAHEYPREIAYVPALPLTATGKIKRKDLRERGADACPAG